MPCSQNAVLVVTRGVYRIDTARTRCSEGRKFFVRVRENLKLFNVHLCFCCRRTDFFASAKRLKSGAMSRCGRSEGFKRYMIKKKNRLAGHDTMKWSESYATFKTGGSACLRALMIVVEFPETSEIITTRMGFASKHVLLLLLLLLTVAEQNNTT